MSGLLPHLGAALVVGCLALVIARQYSCNRLLLSGSFFAIALLTLAPIAGFPASHYIRVLTGDLSPFGFILLSAASVQVLLQGRRDRSTEEKRTAQAVLIAAIVLYPSALGVSPFDSYSLGYVPVYLGPAVFCLFAWSVWCNYRTAAAGIAIALAAFHFRLLESDNLWDYLIDPAVVVYSLGLLVAERRQSRTTGSQGQTDAA